MTRESNKAHSYSFETGLIHGGVDGDPRTGAVSVPIYQTSTFAQDGLGSTRAGYEYSRSGNPTREALEKLIAELEGGRDGFAFASGLAAITTVLFLFNAGDRILISNNVYGGTFRLLDKVFLRFGLQYGIIDTSDLAAVEAALTPDVRAVLIETPANPLLTITDIEAVSALVREKGILTIVDNTFMTPYLQRPLLQGADIVVHSATKYLAGHSDVIAGLAVTKDPDIAARLRFLQNAVGAILQPWDSWLTIRGIKTLSVRLDRHMTNAIAAADFLREHPGTDAVYFPGFEDFPGHDIHARQTKGPGAMISFLLNPDYDINKFFRNTGIIVLAESLGGVESLINQPSSMTHASIPEALRDQVGISDRLIRISIGIEDKDDILSSLAAAFEAAKK